MAATYAKKVLHDEGFVNCATEEDFEQWCQDGFWNDAEDFEQDTGISFEDIQGKWFQLVNNRVYFLKET